MCVGGGSLVILSVSCHIGVVLFLFWSEVPARSREKETPKRQQERRAVSPIRCSGKEDLRKRAARAACAGFLSLRSSVAPHWLLHLKNKVSTYTQTGGTCQAPLRSLLLSAKLVLALSDSTLLVREEEPMLAARHHAKRAKRCDNVLCEATDGGRRGTFEPRASVGAAEQRTPAPRLPPVRPCTTAPSSCRLFSGRG